MNNNAEQYDHIESFLLEKLSPEAKSDFEIAMRRDAALAEAVELRRLEFDVAEALIANDIRAQMARLQEEHPPDDGTTKPEKSGTAMRYWLLFAALLCCAAFVVWRWPQNWQPAPDLPTPSTPQRPVDTIPTTQTPSSDTPLTQPVKPKPGNVDRQQALRLYQKPELGGLRSSETHTDPLSDALNAWGKGDYDEASRLAAAVSLQDPSYWKAQYLCAHAAFLRQQYTSASRFFTQISASKVMPWAEEADWYVLLSLMAEGKKGTQVFDHQYLKIKNDPGHPYSEALKQIK